MGYRSSVMALIYPDAESPEADLARYEQLKVLMATTFKATIDGTDAVDGFSTCMTWVDDERVLKFELQDVKWYPTYSDVQAFMAMLEAFDGDSSDEIPGYCTEYVRIGEESSDVEQEYRGDNNHYYLAIRRSIDCNV